jgi:hypothetical protein
MHRITKIAIIVNIVLALLYVVSSYYLWSVVNGPSWSYYGAVASWSPLYVTPTWTQPIQQREYLIGLSIPMEMVNIPFLIFVTMVTSNILAILISTKKYAMSRIATINH